MPNWCVTKYVATGSRKDIEALAKTLNELPNAIENGFGRLWIGNLFARFGYGEEEILRGRISCRGILDPDYGTEPCFCGPEDPDKNAGEVKFTPYDGGTRLAFAATTAWGPSGDLNDLIEEKFPSVTLCWWATDEFANFHTVHNPLGLTWMPRFYFAGENYSEDEADSLVEYMTERCTGLDIPETIDELASKEFGDRFKKWHEAWCDEVGDDDEEERDERRCCWFEAYEAA